MEPLLGLVNLTNVPGPESGHGHHEFSPIITINALKRADWQRPRIDWVIVGGESGPGGRPMHPDWARSLRDQCASAGVPYLFKQWGEWLPWHHFGCARVEDPPGQTQFKTMEFVDGDWVDVGYPDCWASKDGDIDDMQCVGRVGKKKAGRLLDGIEHNGFPGGAA
jgi:protein gp37